MGFFLFSILTYLTTFYIESRIWDGHVELNNKQIELYLTPVLDKTVSVISYLNRVILDDKIDEMLRDAHRMCD